MTVAVVKKYEDKIIIAADSQMSIGGNKELDVAKITTVGKFTFASAGRVDVHRLLQLFAKTHSPKEATPDAMLEFLSEYDSWLRNKTKNEVKWENQNIFVFEGKVFRCWSFDIEEIKDYTAVGCGMFLALGVLSMNGTPRQAVETAIKYDIGCGGNCMEVVLPVKDEINFGIPQSDMSKFEIPMPEDCKPL